MLNIGFIGLGNMGLPMSINLAKKGHNIEATDINKKIANQLENTPIVFKENLSNTVKNKEVIIMMLPNSEIVEKVWSDIINYTSKDTIIIDCSTIDIDTSKHLNEKSYKRGLHMLDAPVSGGVKGAKDGTLTFMVGGDTKIFKKITPLLEAMGSKSIHCGPSGSGQLAKTCNNLVLAITMIGVSEAFNLAKKSSLDLKILFDVLSTSTASCWAINKYCPVPSIGPESPSDKNYKGGFSTSLMGKDLGIAIKSINSSSSSSTLGREAKRIYDDMKKNDLGDLDFSVVINYLNKN